MFGALITARIEQLHESLRRAEADQGRWLVSGWEEGQSPPIQAPCQTGAGHGGRSSIPGAGQGNIQQHSQTGGIEMKEYAAVFEKTSNGWSAYAPDLPELGVAGATFEETEQLLREGIEFHIEGMVEDGLLIPEPQTQVMRLAIPA